MAITYVSAQELYEGSPTSPQTTAINTGTRTNGLLVVEVYGMASNTVSAFSMTYAGISMTKDVDWNSVGNEHFWKFSIPAPSPDSDNLVITFTVDSGGSFIILYWVASWYDGAKQAAPFDISTTGSGATDPSVSHTPNFNNCLCLFMYKSEANGVLSVGAGETLILDEDFGTRVSGVSYDIQGTAESQTFDFSGPNNDWYGVVGSYQEAAAVGRTTKNTDPQGLGIASGVSRTIKTGGL